MPEGAVFTSTALAAIIGCLAMAFIGKLPFGLAPGMGLNAFFVYGVCLGMGYDWPFALTAVFLEGILFIILTLTNVREAIVNCIPANLRYAIGAGIGTLGTAQAEFHDAIAFCRIADARGLGGDEALVVDDVEKGRLDELRFHDRGNDLYHGLSGEHKGSFGDRVDRACEAEFGKVSEEILVKDAEPAKIIDVLFAEMELFDILYKLFDTAHDRIAAAEGIISEERVEDDSIVLFLILKISLHHSQFIQIC